MGLNFQRSEIGGNATHDAEVKTSTDGETSFVVFGVAVNDPKNTEEVTFYRVVQFGEYGKKLAPHIKRGKEVIVFGRTSSVEVYEGRATINMIADQIILGASPKKKTNEQLEKAS